MGNVVNMVQPPTAVEFPHSRRYVLEMLALLADTQRRELPWFSGMDGEGWEEGIKLIWSILILDWSIAEARTKEGSVYVAGEEVRRLEACGQLFISIFERHREEIRSGGSWGILLTDADWPRLVELATDALVAMVSNWGFPESFVTGGTREA